MKSVLTCLLLLITLSHLKAQKQNNIWYFGFNAGLDFNGPIVEPLQSDMVAIEGCATVSDPNGQILFYTNGRTIWDRMHNIMPNGNGLSGGSSSTQAATIVPYPASKTKYYVLTSEDPSTNGGLSFSILDMKLNGGLGDIAIGSKNILIVDKTSERIVSIPHSNGVDTWIITHTLDSNKFLSFLISSSGIDITPIESSIGFDFSTSNSIGMLKSSHDGSAIVSSATYQDVVEMFEFNTTLGTLSNLVDLGPFFPSPPSIYGIEFSPNDSLIYLSSLNPDSSTLYQFEIASNDLTILNSHKQDDYGALQLAPNGKIYLARFGNKFLDVIGEPNKKGSDCLYEENAISLKAGTMSASGLPGFVSYSFALDSSLQFSLGRDTVLCNGSSLVILPSIRNDCDSLNYFWSDATTSADLEVFQTGEYWLELTGPCGLFRDTIQVNFLDCTPIIHYDLESCHSTMSSGSHMDYSEFVPSYPEILECSAVRAGVVYRTNPQINKHSCTPGIGDSVAMCIGSLQTCTFEEGHSSSLVFEVLVTPKPGSKVQLGSIEFFERSPVTYDWINGDSGQNNYPTLFGLRVIKSEIEIFKQIDLGTHPDWTKVSFNFLNDTFFSVMDSSLFRFELLPYCPVGNGSLVSVWDIDEIKIFGACNQNNLLQSNILGNVKNIQGKYLKDVLVELDSTTLFKNSYTTRTNSSGVFTLDYPKTSNDRFLRCSKNNDLLNGVSTIDIIKIQRHLLGFEPFNSLHQYIAADINHNGSVNVLDLVNLRKVLLGKIISFPNNTSWRFGQISEFGPLPDLNAFQEVIRINRIKHDSQTVNFVGIKVGDLNEDIELGGMQNIIARTSNKVKLSTHEQIIQANVPIVVPIFAESRISLYGLQFGLNLQDLEFVNLLSDKVRIDEQNFNLKDNRLGVSWNSSELTELESGDILFNIILLPKRNLFLSQSLSISDFITPEIYIDNLEIVPIDFGVTDTQNISTDKSNLRLYPTLATEAVTIVSTFQESEPIKICFLNHLGQVIKEFDRIIVNGEYFEEFDLDDLKLTPGLVYCFVNSKLEVRFNKFIYFK